MIGTCGSASIDVIAYNVILVNLAVSREIHSKMMDCRSQTMSSLIRFETHGMTLFSTLIESKVGLQSPHWLAVRSKLM